MGILKTFRLANTNISQGLGFVGMAMGSYMTLVLVLTKFLYHGRKETLMETRLTSFFEL